MLASTTGPARPERPVGSPRSWPSAAAIAAEGPYDLIVDYLWGAPAEALFAALTRKELRSGDGPERIRYVQVGIAAPETTMAGRQPPDRVVVVAGYAAAGCLVTLVRRERSGSPRWPGSGRPRGAAGARR